MKQMSEHDFKEHVEEITGIIKLLASYDKNQRLAMFETASIKNYDEIKKDNQKIYNEYIQFYNL